jgi:hypothetical protein
MNIIDKVHEDREAAEYLDEMDYLDNCTALTEAKNWK